MIHVDKQRKQRAYLLSTSSASRTRQEAEASVKELHDLVDTMGMEIAGSQVVSLFQPNPKFFIGTGKADQLTEQCRELEADCIVFDQDLSPSQQRNLEGKTRLCVIDRREVILQIFADRATTKEAVLQVNLARLEYSLPRLTRAWTHLSRQRGGTRGTRGEGEKQLEVDRRIVVKKIAKTKEELAKIKTHRQTQRKQRRSLPVPTGSIVGYTNAGKSSLLNALAQSDITVENKLFATLDPTTRRVKLPGGSEILLSDTVGFIRDLPHDLIESFSSTLEESVYSDFLMIVLDASDPNIFQQYETTMGVLHDLSCLDRPVILVLNKIDLCPDDLVRLHSLQAKHAHCVTVSVKQGKNMDELTSLIEEVLYENYARKSYNFPLDRYDLLEYLRKHGRILFEEYGDDRIAVTAQVPPQFLPPLEHFT